MENKKEQESYAIIPLQDLMALNHYIGAARTMEDKDYGNESYTSYAIGEANIALKRMIGFL